MIPENKSEEQDKINRSKKALYNVIDPELLINIIDLGLVYNIKFNGNIISVTMTLTTPFCPMGESITNGVHNALEKEFPGHEIDIHLTFDPGWNVKMMTPEGRAQLEK